MLFGVLEFTDFAVIAGLILLPAGGGAAARAYVRPVDRDRLARVEHKLDPVLTHLGIEYVPPAKATWQALADDPARKIEAIKAHRAEHGRSLAAAKAAVEAYQADRGAGRRGRPVSPGRETRPGSRPGLTSQPHDSGGRVAFIKLYPPDGGEALPVAEVVRRLREEFAVADADPDEGQDHVGNVILATLRFSDAVPGKAERLAWLQKVRPAAVYVWFGDDYGTTAGCCVLPDSELFFDAPAAVRGPARPLVDRAAEVLGYRVHEG